MVAEQVMTSAGGVRSAEQIRGDRLDALLSRDLDFHAQDSGYASHSVHAFPAKFPPQLPKLFIEELTSPGDVVLDPMMGSGTTLLEAYLSGRRGLGFDIDLVAFMLSKAKVTFLDSHRVAELAQQIVNSARHRVSEHRGDLEAALQRRWDASTREFVDYWFAYETQIELLALISAIEKIINVPMRAFFELAFSAIIITKSGGVSLAFDLAHTRPHRAKIVVDSSGEFLLGGISPISHRDAHGSSSRRCGLLSWSTRSECKRICTHCSRSMATALSPTSPVSLSQPSPSSTRGLCSVMLSTCR